MALLGATVIAVFDLYRYFEGEQPGETFLFDSTAGGAVFVGLLVVAGASIGRWWAPAIALSFAVSQVALAVAGVDPPDGVGPPLEWPLLIFQVLWFALLVAAGVGARKVAKRLAASLTARPVS